MTTWIYTTIEKFIYILDFRLTQQQSRIVPIFVTTAENVLCTLNGNIGDFANYVIPGAGVILHYYY